MKKKPRNARNGNKHTKQEIKYKDDIKNISKLLQGYLPIEREETNGSSARQSAVLYMVLAVLDG